jgi:hypothetical protein
VALVAGAGRRCTYTVCTYSHEISYADAARENRHSVFREEEMRLVSTARRPLPWPGIPLVIKRPLLYQVISSSAYYLLTVPGTRAAWMMEAQGASVSGRALPSNGLITVSQ